jgi:hypothetical protein
MKKKIIFIFSLFPFLLPNLALADTCTGLFSTGDCKAQAGLPDLLIYTQNILSLFTALAGPIALVAVIYAGVLYMTSMGDESKVKKAKATLVYSLIGVAVITLSYFMVSLVVAFVKKA